MASGTEYTVGTTDQAKAKRYERRLFVANQKFDNEKDTFADWWHRYENLPRRKQVTSKGHRVNVPTGVAVIDALYSSMTAVDVEVILTAQGKTTRPQAELGTLALAHEWEALDVQGQGNAAVKDSLVVGIGWVKVSYEYHSEQQNVPRTDDDVRNDIEALIAEAEAYGHDIDAQTIADFVPLVEEKEVVLLERIVCDYVPWNRVLWDPARAKLSDVAVALDRLGFCLRREAALQCRMEEGTLRLLRKLR